MPPKKTKTSKKEDFPDENIDAGTKGKGKKKQKGKRGDSSDDEKPITENNVSDDESQSKAGKKAKQKGKKDDLGTAANGKTDQSGSKLAAKSKTTVKKKQKKGKGQDWSDDEDEPKIDMLAAKSDDYDSDDVPLAEISKKMKKKPKAKIQMEEEDDSNNEEEVSDADVETEKPWEKLQLEKARRMLRLMTSLKSYPKLKYPRKMKKSRIL
ncbi:hypothetical protein LSTR_LSTR002429 [Laodelphax striatellus]|uniref:Uncharacterized protein n=1 Tax=Laodelphax striatellus TaxID=195883 RepID=A0A482X338_LAOST|nr:hypothetical protein LSTR_LSTR002429 [Laodelphax striatellus]